MFSSRSGYHFSRTKEVLGDPEGEEKFFEVTLLILNIHCILDMHSPSSFVHRVRMVGLLPKFPFLAECC
jgi:hypothetical protein